MIFEKENMIEYILIQLKNFFPLFNSELDDRKILEYHFDEIESRYTYCISKNKTFKNDNSIDPLHIMKYPIFLYFTMNTIYQNESDSNQYRLLDRLHGLNKYLHGCNIYYKVNLPRVFLLSYASGTVLLDTNYGENIIFYHGTTVGATRGKAPVFKNNIIVMPNCIISGDCQVGSNVVISAGSRIINQNIPDNSLVYSDGNKVHIKELTYNYFGDYFYDAI